MTASPFIPQGDEWKNPSHVAKWMREQVWKKALSWVDPRGAIQWENEALTTRAVRLEPGLRKPKSGKTAAQARHQVPDLIALEILADGSEHWILSPAAHRASEDKLEKAKAMMRAGLTKKAQRELACDSLGGEVECRNGHKFRVHYACGNRYCKKCGPKGANRLFAKQHSRLFFAAQRLTLCGVEGCSECDTAIAQERLPHWPPPRGARPRVVCAKIDFTLRHERGDQMPAPERMRQLNRFIKKFCRALEKQFRISRKEYGLAYCDELGGNNSNPHAHGIYVGPWLPQKQKELSALWHEITGDSFILSIKYAEDFSKALFHAVKYPAKFAERSNAQRLADLEQVFHRVRRFHTLAAFYNPECPPEEKPPAKRCPLCDECLSQPRGFETIAELARRGLEDLEAVAVRVNRDRALEGATRAPP